MRVHYANEKLDEIVAEKVTIHLEQMDKGHWWMAIEHKGQTHHLNLFTKRGAEIHANFEQDV